MISQSELARIKSIDLAGIIRSYGIKVDTRYGKFNCPFHSDTNASAKIYKNNTFHCFGCGANGDVVDFVAKIRGTDFREAFRYLGGSESEPTGEERRRLAKEYERQLMHKQCLDWIDAQVNYWTGIVSEIEYQIRLLGLQEDDFTDWEWESLKRLSKRLTTAQQELEIYRQLRQKYEEDINNAKHK